MPVTLASEQNTEEYNEFATNRFLLALDEPLSTFSIDVDNAAYSNVRRFINQGTLPPVDAIRTEEFLNYFAYDYPAPRGNDPVSITTEVPTPHGTRSTNWYISDQGKRNCHGKPSGLESCILD